MTNRTQPNRRLSRLLGVLVVAACLFPFALLGLVLGLALLEDRMDGAAKDD